MTTQQLNSKMRWHEHPENASLQQLIIKNCGIWRVVDGTTVNSCADMLKYCIMDKYTKSLYGVAMEDIK